MPRGPAHGLMFACSSLFFLLNPPYILVFCLSQTLFQFMISMVNTHTESANLL